MPSIVLGAVRKKLYNHSNNYNFNSDHFYTLWNTSHFHMISFVLQAIYSFIHLFNNYLPSTYYGRFRHWGYNREHRKSLSSCRLQWAGHERITSEPKIPTIVSIRKVTYRVWAGLYLIAAVRNVSWERACAMATSGEHVCGQIWESEEGLWG